MTVDVFDLGPTDEELRFARGDTVVWQRVIIDDTGAVVDVTGFQYELTVDEQSNPPDSSTNIFSVIASIPVGTDGRILFQFSTTDWDAVTDAIGEPPAVAFYDLEQTDLLGNRRTVRKGAFRIVQDIKKP